MPAMAVRARRGDQRELLAILVAASALVLPLAGAISYASLGADEGGGGRWWPMPVVGAASQSDIVGPVLLVGALAIVVLGGRGSVAGGLGPATCALIVVGAAVQAAGFVGVAFELVRPDSGFFVPGDGLTSDGAIWSTAGGLVLQAVVCAVGAWFAMRWSRDLRRSAADV